MPAVGGEGGAAAHRAVVHVDRARYVGGTGVRSFPIVGRFEVPDPALFEVEVAAVRFGALTLRRTTMSAHRAIIDGRLRATGEDGVLLVVVQHGGVVAVPRQGAPLQLLAGDAVFIGRDRQYAFQADDTVTLVVAAVPQDRLPPAVRRLGGLPPGPLPHVPLVDALIALLTALASRFDEPMGFDAGFAERGVVDLETAILFELLGGRTAADLGDRVREAVVEYIDRHITDSALAPPTIAAGLGMSLRSLHAAFAGSGTTVSRTVRDRRLDLVAEAVRTAAKRPSSASLAARFGYPGPDALTRAFRRRFDRSIIEFRAAEASGDAGVRHVG